MPQYNLLDTDTVTFNNIFQESGNYKVPDFQRDYSWEEEQWEDLWSDILLVKDNENAVHYMGAIVLQDKGDKVLRVIDGQQRLATLSIIALAVIKRIDDLIETGVQIEQNKFRKDGLRRQYIGGKSNVSLHYSNRLKLNEENEWFYSKHLVNFEKPINKQKLSVSNKLLQDAFDYYYAKIKELFGKKPNGKGLADFLENQIGNKLAFIQIVVKKALDAYIVFETLNSRGIELGISDLLKNYLLSLTAESTDDKKQAKEQWKRIIQVINLNEFPVFLRFFWASRHKTIRKEQLYKELRYFIDTKNKAFTLLRDLEENAYIYAALKNPNDDEWNGKSEIKTMLSELKLFGVRQPFPLLMSVYSKLPLYFEDVLRFCTIIAFRYNIIGGLDPKKQENVFHATAQKVFNGKIKTIKQIANELGAIYPSDEQFVNSFSTKQYPRNKSNLAKYILCSIESRNAEKIVSFEIDKGTIEHILPENPKIEWDKSIPSDEQKDFVYRLGNLTLIEKKKNDACANEIYGKKVPIYKTSEYKITKKIDYPEWKTKQIKARQLDLAKTATTVWRISQITDK